MSIVVILFCIASVVYFSDNRNFVSFKTSFCHIVKMASSGLKEDVAPNKTIVRNVVLNNIFPMVVRGVLL